MDNVEEQLTQLLQYVCSLRNCGESRDADQREGSTREAKKSTIINAQETDDDEYVTADGGPEDSTTIDTREDHEEVYVDADESAYHLLEVNNIDIGRLSTKSRITRIHPKRYYVDLTSTEVLENMCRKPIQEKESPESNNVNDQPGGVISPNEDAATDLLDRSYFKWDSEISAAIEEVLGSRPSDPHVRSSDGSPLVENNVTCDFESEIQYIRRGNIPQPNYGGAPPRQGIVVGWDNSVGKGEISERHTNELRTIQWRQLRPYYGALNTGISVYYQWVEGDFVNLWVTRGMPCVR